MCREYIEQYSCTYETHKYSLVVALEDECRLTEGW
jgi:hypothetical protein